MTEPFEPQIRATKLVHWPTGPTYTCDHHASALRKIASTMGIHLSVQDYSGGDRECTNCRNETSIARGDAEFEARAANQQEFRQTA